eukprot:TRINITY_DN5067_c0_g1_i2.p2 TRINITY_DN5067_c0_g1~~TRINITY_DN5067_c0_g1_i2.p2  ORF type:complete len:132 (-),score=50.02 TRINITY_DN5067_c0_g1_i2:41-436(-)
MHIEYHKWFSPSLQQDFETKVYGHAGVPMLVFPTARGKFHEFEDFKMIEQLSYLINDGRLKVFCPDGRDEEALLSTKRPEHKASRYNDYLDCITKEVIPFIHKHYGNRGDRKIMTGGAPLVRASSWLVVER